tara:strand:- start:4337 stop:4768 length:432 start_codon:yes stop_codon:yes gene_type:complete
MPTNLDDNKGVVVTPGTGLQRNGVSIASTAAEWNEMSVGSFIQNMAGGGGFCTFPFDGEITGGYAMVTADPGGATVVALAVTGGSGAAGVFNIADGTGNAETDALSLASGTKTFTAGTKLVLTLSTPASNAVTGFFIVTAKRT